MKKTSILSFGLLLVAGVNASDVSSSRLTAQETVPKAPFSLSDFPGLEVECLAALGGRGPFGFRPGEMEQALIMTLMK